LANWNSQYDICHYNYIDFMYDFRKKNQRQRDFLRSVYKLSPRKQLVFIDQNFLVFDKEILI